MCGGELNCGDTSLIVLPEGGIGATGPAGPIGPQGPVFEPTNVMYYCTTLPIQRPFTGGFLDLPVGINLPNQVEHNVTELTLTNLTPGRYLVNSNLFCIFGSYQFYSLGMKGYFNYELRVNGVLVPYSTRTTLKAGGTPEEFTTTDSTVGEVIITSTTDTIELWVYVTPTVSGVVDTNFTYAVLQSGSVWAHRLTVD